MRYLDKQGKIGWKASPRFLTKLADAERDAQVIDLTFWNKPVDIDGARGLGNWQHLSRPPMLLQQLFQISLERGLCFNHGIESVQQSGAGTRCAKPR
jgi:hypothetical protein